MNLYIIHYLQVTDNQEEISYSTHVAGKLFLSCNHDALPGPRLSYPLQPNIWSISLNYRKCHNRDQNHNRGKLQSE